MNRRSIAINALVATLLCLAGIFAFDRPVASLVHSMGGEHSKLLAAGTHLLEVASGMSLSKFLLGSVLLASGLALLVSQNTRHLAWILLFIGCTQFSCRLIAGVLKDIFLRLRPFEVLANEPSAQQFFVPHGNSFPSGHAAHFWALFFPLAFLFPRLSLPLIILPTFVVVARVGVNDHWASDVLASIAISAVVTLFFIWLFRKRLKVAHAPSVIPRTSPTISKSL